MAHFQREDHRRLAFFDANVGGDAQRERRLSHGRSSTNNVQRAPLQAVELVVKIEKTGGYTCDGVAAVVELFKAIEACAEQVVQRNERVGDAALSHIEHHLLGAVHGAGDIFGKAVAEVSDFAGDTDEAPEHEVLVHDRCVQRRVGGGRSTCL